MLENAHSKYFVSKMFHSFKCLESNKCRIPLNILLIIFFLSFDEVLLSNIEARNIRGLKHARFYVADGNRK